MPIPPVNPTDSCIALTVGEPAGIGPDLVVTLAQQSRSFPLVAIGDPELLQQRARQLQLPLTVKEYAKGKAVSTRPGELSVAAIPLAAVCRPGVLDATNADAVLATLRRATDGCLGGEFAAMVTAPVQKSVIAESGTPFSGHTEFLAEHCGGVKPVMLLCTDTLRVALLTTHLSLRSVPDAITFSAIDRVVRIVDRDLRRLFGIMDPRIAVLGLNPHAGENGHLGREEISVIEPALRALRSDGLQVSGPLPADSAFTPAALAQCDVVVAMYHDQGLPVLKHAGFGHAVNVTLGLPVVRTSVDHGTALELAGTGRADGGSLQAALDLAVAMAQRKRSQRATA